MKQISNKEYENYQQYQIDKLHGRILTPDGLRVICAGLDNDPEKIGIHMGTFTGQAFISSNIDCRIWLSSLVQESVEISVLDQTGIFESKPKNRRIF